MVSPPFSLEVRHPRNLFINRVTGWMATTRRSRKFLRYIYGDYFLKVSIEHEVYFLKVSIGWMASDSLIG